MAGGVGASGKKIDRVADREVLREPEIRVLGEDVGAVAGRAGKDRAVVRSAVMRCAEAVRACLKHRLPVMS